MIHTLFFHYFIVKNIRTFCTDWLSSWRDFNTFPYLFNFVVYTPYCAHLTMFKQLIDSACIYKNSSYAVFTLFYVYLIVICTHILCAFDGLLTAY